MLTIKSVSVNSNSRMMWYAQRKKPLTPWKNVSLEEHSEAVHEKEPLYYIFCHYNYKKTADKLNCCIDLAHYRSRLCGIAL